MGENDFCLIDGSHLIRHLSFSTGAQDASGTLDSVHACSISHCHPVVSQKNYTVERFSTDSDLMRMKKNLNVVSEQKGKNV